MSSHFLLQGIFPTQGSNPGLPHCRWILYQLSYQGNPSKGPYYWQKKKKKSLFRLMTRQNGWIKNLSGKMDERRAEMPEDRGREPAGSGEGLCMGIGVAHWVCPFSFFWLLLIRPAVLLSSPPSLSTVQEAPASNFEACPCRRTCSPAGSGHGFLSPNGM